MCLDSDVRQGFTLDGALLCSGSFHSKAVFIIFVGILPSMVKN